MVDLEKEKMAPQKKKHVKEKNKKRRKEKRNEEEIHIQQKQNALITDIYKT